MKKCTFFDNLRIITQEGNMKTGQMTHFFHLLFLLYLLVTFISEFEDTYNSFSKSLLRSILVWSIFLFILFQKVDTLRLLKIYIMFCLPVGVKYPFFKLQLIQSLSPFSIIFLVKIAFKSPFDLYFHLFITKFV